MGKLDEVDTDLDFEPTLKPDDALRRISELQMVDAAESGEYLQSLLDGVNEAIKAKASATDILSFVTRNLGRVIGILK